MQRFGGASNASTDCETTTFEFEIHQRHFREALGIFAQFFASPLLLPESMNREKEAIDSGKISKSVIQFFFKCCNFSFVF